MTRIDHLLLTLTGDENWEDWGDAWQQHVTEITQLQFVGQRPPSWLREHPSKRLDWGADLFELDLGVVRRLIGARPNYADIKEEWDRPFREAEERQDENLATLARDGRYAVVYVESPSYGW
jgi:hypothetical protein